MVSGVFSWWRGEIQLPYQIHAHHWNCNKSTLIMTAAHLCKHEQNSNDPGEKGQHFLAFGFSHFCQFVSSSSSSQKASLRFRLTLFHSTEPINHKHSGLLRGFLWGTFAVYKSSTQDIFAFVTRCGSMWVFRLSVPGAFPAFQERAHKIRRKEGRTQLFKCILNWGKAILDYNFTCLSMIVLVIFTKFL